MGGETDPFIRALVATHGQDLPEAEFEFPNAPPEELVEVRGVVCSDGQMLQYLQWGEQWGRYYVNKNHPREFPPFVMVAKSNGDVEFVKVVHSKTGELRDDLPKIAEQFVPREPLELPLAIVTVQEVWVGHRDRQSPDWVRARDDPDREEGLCVVCSMMDGRAIMDLLPLIRNKKQNITALGASKYGGPGVAHPYMLQDCFWQPLRDATREAPPKENDS
jgi:hypothetical protein